MPKFLTEILLQTVNTTPDSGFISIYMKVDKKLYAKTSDGIEIQLSINPV